MAKLNRCSFIGRLTKDPEMRFTVEGKAVTKFSIAVNGWKDGDVDFINCVSFNKLAEVCGEYLKKGQEVYVEGALKISNYEDNEGIKKQSHSINLQTMQMLGNKPAESAKVQQDDTFDDIRF